MYASLGAASGILWYLRNLDLLRMPSACPKTLKVVQHQDACIAKSKRCKAHEGCFSVLFFSSLQIRLLGMCTNAGL